MTAMASQLQAWLEPVADHLWQSTLLLIAVAIAAHLLRRQRSQVRYWLWLAASVKFLVPFSWLTALGRTLLPPAQAPPLSGFVEPVSAVIGPFSQWTTLEPSFASAAPASWLALLPVALFVVWAVGLTGIAGAWMVRWKRAASVARAGEPAAGGRELARLRHVEGCLGTARPLPLVLSTASIEPGVFGIVRPLLLWPARISAHLDDHQIDAILAHELWHVRRRDNLAAVLQMTAQALFWFHPLVWWLGQRLVDERERACDEAVLNMGSDPDAYAEGILATCRLSFDPPLACVSGVAGGELGRRIARIMTHENGRTTSRRLAVALVAAAVTLVVVPVVVGSLQPRPAGGMAPGAGVAPALMQTIPAWRLERVARIGPALHGYSLKDVVWRLFSGASSAVRAAAPQTPPPPSLSFEVASIKENKSGDNRISIGMQPGGRFTATNMPARELITFAFGIQRAQMEGGPDWLDTARFDVTAKAPDGQPLPPTAPGEAGPMNLMMRALLADRFKLVVERVTRDAPIYELVKARADGRLGPGIEPATVDCAALAGGRGNASGPPPPLPRIDDGGPGRGGRPPCSMMMSPISVIAGGQPMTQLARLLTQRVGRPVIDRTGLTGNYDFMLEFSPEPGFAPGPPPPGAPPLVADPDKPSLFAALQEQLGLKLEAKRGPVEVLVITSMALPTPD